MIAREKMTTYLGSAWSFQSHAAADSGAPGADIGDSYGVFDLADPVTFDDEEYECAWQLGSGAAPVGSDKRVSFSGETPTQLCAVDRVFIQINANVGMQEGALSHSSSRMQLFVNDVLVGEAYGQHRTASGNLDRCSLTLSHFARPATPGETQKIKVRFARYGGHENMRLLSCTATLLAS